MSDEIKIGDIVTWKGGETNNHTYTAVGRVISLLHGNTGGSYAHKAKQAKIDIHSGYPFNRNHTTISVDKLIKKEVS